MKTPRFTIATLLFLTLSFSAQAQNKNAAKKPAASRVTPSSAPEDQSSERSEKLAPSSEAAKAAVDFSAKDIWSKELFERDDNKVLVIQDRKYNKSGRLELGVDLGMTAATGFYNTYTSGLRAAYYFNEYWGLQWFGNYSTSTTSREKEQLDNFFNASNFTTQKEYKQPRLFTGVGVLWNPIYGKFAWFRSRIIHFDIYAGLGLSYLTNESSMDFDYLGNRYKGHDDKAIGSLANLGIRIFLAKGWAWTTEIRNNIYKAEFARTRTGSGTLEIAGKDVWQNNFQFTTGVSYLFNIGGY